jgi:hypothetical protein
MVPQSSLKVLGDAIIAIALCCLLKDRDGSYSKYASSFVLTNMVRFLTSSAKTRQYCAPPDNFCDQ